MKRTPRAGPESERGREFSPSGKEGAGRLVWDKNEGSVRKEPVFEQTLLKEAATVKEELREILRRGILI